MDRRKGENSREPSLPPSSFKAFAATLESLVADGRKHGPTAPDMFDDTSSYCLRIARALYSAGEPVAVCKPWLDEAAKDYLRFVEGKAYKFDAIGNIEEWYLERFPAAFLVGRAPEVVHAFRRCTFDKPLAPWEKCLLHRLCAVLVGEPVVLEPKEVVDLQKRVKIWVSLPRLFQAVSDKDRSTFADALEEYLVKARGPGSDKSAKVAQKRTNPEYAGKWCFLAAAMCQIMGEVPEISKKAQSYIPVDLLTV
jgi:hypothetical protein